MEEKIIYQGSSFVVVQVCELSFPGFLRLIWHEHITEFSDLTADERYLCVDVLVEIERILREVLQPTKVNVASLGNQTPHLHWHIIARFDWDTHFPGSVWSEAQRPADAEKLTAVQDKMPHVHERIAGRLSELFAH